MTILDEALNSLQEHVPYGYTLEIRIETDAAMAILTDAHGAFFEADLYTCENAEKTLMKLFDAGHNRPKAKP